MNAATKMLLALFALFVFFSPALPPDAAHAQQYPASYAAPTIGGFDVAQVRRLVAGTELNFTLYGTPGGIAIISIPGATSRLLLEEVDTGLYQGTYTIKTRDKIAANARVTVNLRLGNQVASMVLDEPLIAPAAKTAAQRKAEAAAGAAPRIDRFDVVPNQLVSGSDLHFTLHGTPGARASVRIAGAQGRIFLEETRSGIYEGIYTIKTVDRITPDSRTTAILRAGDHRARAVLGKSLLASGAQPGTRRVARSCANCGVVEAVNVIEVKGDGGYLGMIAGGVIGGLLGHQIGGGRGQTAATVVGAAGGAVAGREVEKRAKATKHYEVIVRLESGGTQVVSYPAVPGFKVGDKVRVENGTLVGNP